MKISKDGKLILSAKDKRLGNFVITEQPEYWRISDLGERITIRYHKTTLVGQMLTLWVTKGGNIGDKYVDALCITFYEVLSIVPDEKAMEGHLRICKDAVARHPELYGGKEGETTEAEHEEALKEVQEVQEVIDHKGDGN